MEGQEKTIKNKSIPWLAFWGALGFGIGGVVSGGTLLIPAPRLYFITFGFFLLGALGGAYLGWASGGRKRAVPLALAGSIGFGCGFILSLFIGLEMAWKWNVGPLTEVATFVAGAIIGAIGGASLGIALKNRRAVGFLAIAGAIGFGLPWQITESMFSSLSLQPLDAFKPIAILAISSTVSGACMGATLGYLEKRSADRDNRG